MILINLEISESVDCAYAQCGQGQALPLQHEQGLKGNFDDTD
ncbi:MAG: hypothetical protein WBP93_15585 [Pyrinomonadaceae bacterium]